MGALPTGTVTFLFTDIEGSTRLWEDEQAAMEAALRWHDDLLRGTVAANGGYVFSTAGDSFAVAFGRPGDAVRCAVEVQRALEAPGAAHSGLFRVRMGIHTGTADERDGDYFGPTVNRAARIMGAAHGAQILASDVTANLVSEARWHDHGAHRLADLGQPMRLLEARLSDAIEPRAPRSLTTQRGNLPQRLTSFVGREEELDQLAELLRSNRVVTLVGVGGTGKTRLALHAAADGAPAYPDGTWFLELGLTRSSSALAEMAIATLGIPIGQGTSPNERLIDHLSTRELLLIVDNCEHVRDAAAQLVAEIALRCPGVTILATSREPLLVAGEHLMAVGSLATLDGAGPAVELFRERALAEGRSLPDDADHRAAVTRICERLDGIPLAIELAAARVRTLPIDQIEDLLGERFRILTGGRHGSAERHQTLRATVAWSYDLLTVEEQEVFDHLSVFAGSFDLDAAVAVGTKDGADRLAVVEALGSLVDKSMCVMDLDQPLPYRLLETMRTFGRENLVVQDLIDAQSERHAAHFAERLAATTPRLFAGDETPAADEMYLLVPEVRSAFSWASAAGAHDLARRLIQPLWPVSWRGWYAPTLWVAAAEDDLSRKDWVIDWLTYEAWMRVDADAGRALERELSSREPDGTSSRVPTLIFAALFELTLNAPGDANERLEAAAGEAVTPVDRTMGLFFAAVSTVRQGRGSALAEAAIAEARRHRWHTGEAFGLVARAMTLDDASPDARYQACVDAYDFAVRVGCQEVEGIALQQMLGPMLDQPIDAVAPHAIQNLQYWIERGNAVNIRVTTIYTAAYLAEAGAHEAAVVAAGFLDGFKGVIPRDVQDRLDVASRSALASVANADRLLQRGRSMSMHEIAAYLTGQLRTRQQ